METDSRKGVLQMSKFCYQQCKCNRQKEEILRINKSAQLLAFLAVGFFFLFLEFFSVNFITFNYMCSQYFWYLSYIFKLELKTHNICNIKKIWMNKIPFFCFQPSLRISYVTHNHSCVVLQSYCSKNMDLWWKTLVSVLFIEEDGRTNRDIMNEILTCD